MYLVPTSDANKMFSISSITDKGGDTDHSQGLEESTGSELTILDQTRALPPSVGNDCSGKRAWNLGYNIGHADVGLEHFSGQGGGKLWGAV